MLMGETLIAEGLVTPADIQRALAYQHQYGGRFGDCAVTLRLVSEQQIEEVLSRIPQAPASLQEVDVEPMLLLQLMVKGFHVENLETPSQIVQAMKLRAPLVKELLQEGVERKLIAVVGQANAGSGAFSELRYELTGAGHDWAVESLGQSQYFGPAPVSLDTYHDRVLRQCITSDAASRTEIEEAFSDLVIPDRFVDRLGPAINSATAMLLYGPAGNGKTTIAQRIGQIFDSEIYVPYCFEVDGHIVRVFDPSIHEPVEDPRADERTPLSMRQDRRWVRCRRPVVITGGELTLDMLDLRLGEHSKFYEAPLHVKALNGIFVIDDFGRQRAAPGDILNRWILPLNDRVDYLSLHTGKTFRVPFDELVIFSTNIHPDALMDAAFLRRIDYKLEAVAPTEPLFRRVFEDVCAYEGLEFDEEMYRHVLESIRAKGASLAYFMPGFIARQVLASSKFADTPPRFTRESVDDAMLNLFVKPDPGAAG